MRDALWIALGGAGGALARYGAGRLTELVVGKSSPWGTLLVNVVGCFMIGLVAQYLLPLEARTAVATEGASQWHVSALRHGLIVGFLGALTTFSAFGWETVRLLEQRHFPLALANIAGNVVLGLLAVWVGMLAVRR